MTATEILDEIMRNYNDVGNSTSKLMEAHAKNIKLLDDALTKQYNSGFKNGQENGKSEKIKNLIEKN